MQDARRAERADETAAYAALLAESYPEVDPATLHAPQRISRFSVLPAALGTAYRVAGRGSRRPSSR